MTRPSWDEYFMAIAVVASSRSSCHHVRAGSVIVSDNHIIGTGYNGTPPGIEKNCIEHGCRKEKAGIKYESAFNVGKCIGIHAEMNALANVTRKIHEGSTLYTTIFPCPTCAKNILAYKFNKVVYMKEYDKEETEASTALFNEAGVEIKKIEITKEKLNEIIFGRDAKKFGVFNNV